MESIRILLADDHALILAGFRNALENQPRFEIVGDVRDGLSLLPALRTLQPDLLLIDINMPSFDPIASIKRVRRAYPELLILVVSAYDDDVYVKGLLREGVHGYYLKGQPLEDLEGAIDSIMSGKRWISDQLVDKLLQPAERAQPIYSKLSPRQLSILRLLTKGLDNRTIATKLGLSVKTIEAHLTRLYRHLRVQSRLEATSLVHENPDILIQSPEFSQVQPMVEAATKLEIVIVDDNQRYRQQLRLMVNRVYPQALVYESADIEYAVNLAGQIKPHLALVDVVLGDENGVDCLTQIKAVAPQTRMILMSAYPDQGFHRKGLEAGAIAFIDKQNLDAAALFQIISEAVG